MSILSTQIVSAINNYSSITPLMVKDLVENVGRTSMAYYSSGKETKNYEATEKFIDANLSSLFWFGSIPLANKVFNKTVFKFAGLNPDVSLSFLKDKEKTQTIDNVIKKIGAKELPENIIYNKKSINTVDVLRKTAENSKKFKNLQIARMLTALTFATYLSAVVLPKSIIRMTQFFVDKKTAKSKPKRNFSKVTFGSFDNFRNKKIKKRVSFKSLQSKLLEKAISAQNSALEGMAAMDIAISSGRIYYANKREKDALKGRSAGVQFAAAIEKFIREAGAFYLIYFGGAHIKKAIDLFTKNKLDPVILEDKNFIKELRSGVLTANPIKEMTESQALDYIDKNINNPDNPFIKYAKKLKWVETVKDKSGRVFRNPIKYLDLKRLNENFNIIAEEAPEFLKQGGKNLEKFIREKAKIKRFGIYANLSLSSFAVCYILPKIMYEFRKIYTGSNEEPGIKQVLKTAKIKQSGQF